MTGSPVGQRMLENWDEECSKFTKVYPHDYRRVLEERAEAQKQMAAQVVDVSECDSE